MKIAWFFDSLKVWGWVEKFQSQLSICLKEQGIDFIHILLEDKNPKNLFSWETYVLEKSFIHWFGIKKIFLLLECAYKISRFCKREKIDIIIGQWDFFYMAVALSKLLFWNSSKTIWVIHTTISVWPTMIKKILLLLLKSLDRVVLISRWEYYKFAQVYNFAEDKIVQIYNWMIFENKSHINVKLDESEDIFRFINIWRLTYQKGQDRLIKAFNVFHKKYSNSELIILWEWELKEDYLRLIQKYKNKSIKLLWNVTNIDDYLIKSDCFLLWSRFEWFWYVLVEAMSQWLPIISTNCPTGPSEILKGKESQDFQITDHGILVWNNEGIDDKICAMEYMYHNRKTLKSIWSNNIVRSKDFDFNFIIYDWVRLFNELH